MKETHNLYHSFIEGPRADLIYRGTARLTNGRAVVDLDEVSDMTSGTFTALNHDGRSASRRMRAIGTPSAAPSTARR